MNNYRLITIQQSLHAAHSRKIEHTLKCTYMTLPWKKHTRGVGWMALCAYVYQLPAISNSQWNTISLLDKNQIKQINKKLTQWSYTSLLPKFLDVKMTTSRDFYPGYCFSTIVGWYSLEKQMIPSKRSSWENPFTNHAFNTQIPTGQGKEQRTVPGQRIQAQRGKLVLNSVLSIPPTHHKNEISISSWKDTSVTKWHNSYTLAYCRTTNDT